LPPVSPAARMWSAVDSLRWSEGVGLGLLQGVVGGVFGIGGSSIGTPLLRMLLDTPPLVALGTPLPLTVPSSIAAAAAYRRRGMVNWRAVRWTAPVAAPAAAAGAVSTRWVPTQLVMMLVALTLLLAAAQLWRRQSGAQPRPDLFGSSGVSARPWALASVGVLVGAASGLLANAGGFLLVPAYVWLLRARVREAAATALCCAPFIALPGIVVHGLLGHIDPSLALQLAIGAVAGSVLGARLSLRFQAIRLRRPFAVLLLAFGIYFSMRVLNSTS